MLVRRPIIWRSSETREIVASWMWRTMPSACTVAAPQSIISAAVMVASMRAMLLRERMYTPPIFTGIPANLPLCL
jgi:hypothetical protein